MLAHFVEYNETLGDNPINLNATGLAANAYMLAHENKYKRWLLEYVDAWVDRARANDDILPSNIGLDGKIGSTAHGKWYGGVYGWGFSPVVPMTGKHADRNRVPRSVVGFMNAYLISGGDERYLEVWRRQADHINEQRKVLNDASSTPRMFGDNGWYTSTVTVATAGVDPISGPVTCTADQQLTDDTASATVAGSCTNAAGLTTDATPLVVKVDTSAPTAQLTVAAGTLGAHGWYTSDVTVATSGTDPTSSPVT